MTVRLETEENTLRIYTSAEEIPPSTKSTLRLKGFRHQNGILEATAPDLLNLVLFSLGVLNRSGVNVELDESTSAIIEQYRQQRELARRNIEIGRKIKNSQFDLSRSARFLKFLKENLARPLLPHQVKAAIHLVNLDHAANFSVPGAGKTAVVLAVYEYLRCKGQLSSLFVVGPRSCFAPWRTEFSETLGRDPSAEILAGGNVELRQRKYFPSTGNHAELYLVTYHTLARDLNHAAMLVRSVGNGVFLVIDEAHYMKQDNGVWANAVLSVANYARKKCVLTGTPFPKDYADGINQFEVLYSNSALFDENKKANIRDFSNSGKHALAKAELEPSIDGLYYRVRKKELGLSKQNFLPIISVEMNPLERELYLYIERRIGELRDIEHEDLETLVKLKRGRIMRLRQATSYPPLLGTAIVDYDEEIVETTNFRLRESIKKYDQLEIPAKLQRLLSEIKSVVNRGEKVVVWANFIRVLHKIQTECRKIGIDSQVVFGGTPTQDDIDEDSRESIIERFKDRKSSLDVLIANPAACAESVSLHKSCSNAIYYDLSYNCAQYLQSLDRIHRVGGSEHTISHYRFLQCADTFEDRILTNLQEKVVRMAEVIDQDFPLADCDLRVYGAEQDFGID